VTIGIELSGQFSDERRRPTSTKNNDKKRDPEMHQVKKGNECFFGMKAHIGSDLQGLAHERNAALLAQPDAEG
jgi:IS5 family transposase